MTSPLDNVRGSAVAVRETRDALTDSIVLAHEAGEKASAIAEAAGVTRQRVYQIIGEAADREAAMRARLAPIMLCRRGGCTPADTPQAHPAAHTRPET
jgi:hypothetical protein